MSRGIHALDKRDQAAVREWLRLEALAEGCRPPGPVRPWLLLVAVMLVSFAVGYMLR